MNTTVLKRLNRMLENALGMNPHGEPYFKWVFAPDLQFPTAASRDWKQVDGIYRIETERLEWHRQVMEDIWLIAAWESPPSYLDWLGIHGTALPYPDKGEYWASTLVLPPGVEPTEQITGVAIGYVKMKRDRIRNSKDLYHGIMEAVSRREREGNRIAGDYIDNLTTAFGNTPGERGHHVSFGGV